MIARLFWICLGATLSSCASFNTRHYTKGIFLESLSGYVPKPSPTSGTSFSFASNTFTAAATGEPRGALITAPVISHSALPPERQKSCQAANRSSQRSGKLRSGIPSIEQNPKTGHLLKSLHRGAGNTTERALLYILAFILALGIIALAIYFLPAILIPSAASSTFISAVVIASAVILILLVLAMYGLILRLIELFKSRPGDPEEDC